LTQGFIAGAILTFIVLYIISRVSEHWKRIAAIGEPQVIKQKTEESPLEVVMSGCKSLAIIVLYLLLLIGCILATHFWTLGE